MGGAYKVETPDGMTEYLLTRWRGLARAVDVDGKQYQVRAWRETKAVAETATEAAGWRKLKDLAAERAKDASDAAGPLRLLLTVT